ncbi:cupin-like domain-containing protein [Mycena metata]|uniref:Cupin-like domain-containing protein n=1 Tax=Mycena metata TaxID=1033252 RepID=A0AAD7KBN9_9AGAR|nr:cupin-like domain-containing protein [Mycena metata]
MDSNQIASEYHDLNGNHIDVLDEPPTALEFSRLAHISRPALIRGMQIPSVRSWDNESLAAAMGNAKISVAVTPNGRADAVTRAPDGKLYFVEPHVEQMSISDLFSKLSGGMTLERNICNSFIHDWPMIENDDSDVYYLQSQNGNVYSSRFFEGTRDPSEFEALRADIPSEIPWCSEAFGRPPDAVNLWIGSHNSVTSIHSDPYENIYTVVRGSKQFTLLPPTEGSYLRERMYPHGTWTRQGTEAGLTLTPSTNAPPIRWSSVIDPDIPGNLPPDAHPICITLEPGETLYLPPGWWHHVRQTNNTIALNWWYDMEMRGMAWVLLSFLRGVGTVPSGNDEDA